MTFKVDLGDGEKIWWSKHQTHETLGKLKEADKSVVWIRSDLSTSESNWFSRMMWGIAKHFEWMREAFYGVDLENSRKILEQLRPQIATQKDKDMITIFNSAIENFNVIAPNHKAEYIFQEDDFPIYEDYNDVVISKPVITKPSQPDYKSTGLFGPSVNVPEDDTPDYTGSFSNSSSIDTSFTASNFVKTSSSVSQNLLTELLPYNHGKMNYNDAAKLVIHPLHNVGTYLIRQSTDSDNMVVTVKTSSISGFDHIRFKILNDKFRNEDGKLFSTLPELAKARGADLLYPIRQGSAHPTHPQGMQQSQNTATVQPPSPVKITKPDNLFDSVKKKDTLFDVEIPTIPSTVSCPVVTSTLTPIISTEPTIIPGATVEENYEFKAKLPGANLDELLWQAVTENRPAIASWLVTQGASIDTLNEKIFSQSYDPTILQKYEAVSQWLTIVAKKIDATPENLDHFALDLGLGYKSANLLIMEKKAEEMSKHLKSSIVKVPPFLPVGNFELSQYLLSEIPQVLELWEQFKNTFDGKAKQGFLDAESNEKASKSGMKITTSGEKILTQISELIQDHFLNNPYQSLQMRDWLKKEMPQFVIVRSTGKEDSDTNSNAGGNASIPYVKPNAEAISEAIGEVIASYFGERSINQRILCGDRSLITDTKPFIPILVQEMVGENIDGKGSKNEDIPRSGVLFTRQSDKAEGVTFIQTGLGNNEGVVSSQVGVDSYFVKDGKIHAVVRQKETRYVSNMNAAQKMTVIPIKNESKALQMNQALHPSVIFDIKQVADDISETYALKSGSPKPMDMEYTVKLKEKGYKKPVIYLLQARPLLSTKGDEKVKYSYLDLQGLKKVEDKRKINAEVLLDGNAYVRSITDTSSVIFADDLPKGEYDFAHTNDDVKVIFIKKTAPATSHEAVILRPKGVAVMVVDNPEEFSRLKKMVGDVSKENPLLVDPQRGLIVSCPTEESKDTLVKEGLVSYPIPLEVTVPPSLHLERLDSFGKIKDKDMKQGLIKYELASFNAKADTLIDELRGVKTEYFNKSGDKIDPFKTIDGKIVKVGISDMTIVQSGGAELLKGYDIQELFDLMATGDATQAKLALATLLNAMRLRLKTGLKGADKNFANLFRPMFQLFEHALYLTSKEIIPAIEKYPPQSLERLYPIKFLNALIYQKLNSNIMGGASYIQVLGEEKSQKAALKKGELHGINFTGPNADSLIKLQQMISNAYNEESSTNWQAFVRDLSKMDQVVQSKLISRLSPILNQTAALDVLSMWMNTTFNQAWKQHSSKSGSTRLEAVTHTLEVAKQGDKATFDWVQERLGFIGNYEKGTNAWADPNTAKKNTKKLIEDFTVNFGFDTKNTKDSLKNRYNAAQPLGKLALLQYIRRAVNAYDCTIKAVKGSGNFKSEKDIALQVADMLEGYLKMMEATMGLITTTEQHTMQKPSMGSAVMFDDYINRLKNGCSYKFGFSSSHTSSGFDKLVNKLRTGSINAAEQLESRPYFAVDSLVVGSKADLNFSAHWPDRLEEYFTTFHQNMEQVVKFLNTKNGLDTTLLAKQAKEICDKSTVKFGQNISSLTTLDNGKLRVGYQIPLRQHSASLMVDYDPQNTEKGTEITVQMFGNDEHFRWDQAAAFGSILAYALGKGFAGGVAPKINYDKPEGSEFSITIPGNFTNVDQLINTIHYITKKMTMGSIGGSGNLVQQINQYIPSIDWGALDPECYKYSLYINKTLMQQLQTSKPEVAATIAISSIYGIAHYGLTDFTRDGGSLLTSALQMIKTQLPTTPSLVAELQSLIKDPQVTKKLPLAVSEIKGELAKMKPPEEAFKDLMQSKDYLDAIVLALKTKNSGLISKSEAFLAEKFQINDTDLLLDLYIKFCMKGYEAEANKMILKNGLEDKLTVEQMKKLQMLKQKEVRKDLLTNLSTNVGKLQNFVANFEVNHDKIMALCLDSLIGLSQASDYQGKAFPGFNHLSGYLGATNYNYIYDNVYNDTSKLRKAAPLYMIKGFESQNPEVRKSAVEAFKKLALDYCLFAQHEKSQIDDIDHVMFALARGYLDATNPLTTAARELFLMFQSDKAIMQKIIHSGKIQNAQKKQALIDVLNK